MYNLTSLQQAADVSDIFIYANTNTGGLLIGLGMLSIFFIMLLVLKKWEFTDALLVSSFISFILSSILSYGQMLNFMFPLTFLLIAAFTAFFVYTAKR